MAPLLACLDCGRLSPKSRCPEHERRYQKRLLEAEPWQYFYKDPRWSRARLRVLARDEGRCTFVVGHRRCITTVPLSVHHTVKLRVLWAKAGRPQRGAAGWERFVKMACDMRDLRALCETHHKLVDAYNPESKWLGVPEERATSQHRRRLRHDKRATSKRRVNPYDRNQPPEEAA